MGAAEHRRELAGLVTIASLVVAIAIPLTAIGKQEKVTICHAAGLAGTDHFVTLELAYPAVYGPGGHFNENGTARAGHESDYLGPCVLHEGDTTTTSGGDSTTTSVAGESTTTEAEVTSTTPVETTTTTAANETTTTTAQAETTTTSAPIETTTTAAPDESTTTTAPEETTTSVHEETTTTTSSVETTTTTAPVETTTTTEPKGPSTANVTITSDETTTTTIGPAQESTEPVEADATVAVDAVALPFTGFEVTLVVPATVLLLLGAAAIYLSGRFNQASGAHVADSGRLMGLGLHRGRHE